MQVTVHCLIVYAYQILPHLTVEAYMYIYDYIKAYIKLIKNGHYAYIYQRSNICPKIPYASYCFTLPKKILHTYPVNVNAVRCLSGTRI